MAKLDDLPSLGGPNKKKTQAKKEDFEGFDFDDVDKKPEKGQKFESKYSKA